MKKTKLLLTALVLTLLLVSCGQKADQGSPDGVTELDLWTFAGPHKDYFDNAAERWNTEFPDRQIKLNSETFPFQQMHNNLLLALQNGSGAPDIVDIELIKFPNFLKGEPQLLPLNELIEDELDSFVTERLDIYAKDGQYYGAPTHLGATVVFYNKEILAEAGVDADDIVTWDDFIEQGKIVVEKTGKPMTTLPSNWYGFWPFIAQRGSDFFSPDGELTLNSDVNIETLEFLDSMVNEHEIAIVTPGGNYHTEEYYGYMNDGGAASMVVPLFYMKDFTEFMPELSGKMLIKPMPTSEGSTFKTVGMGGTGTAITNQTEHEELAKDFLYFAKLSKEGNLNLWSELGFDPARWDVWDSEEIKETNLYYDYFHDGIFDMLMEIKDDIASVTITENLPDVIEDVEAEIMHKVLREKSAKPKDALDQSQQKIQNKIDMD